MSDKLGRTALHNAALVGDEKALQALLEAGAQVDSRLQISSGPRQLLNNHFNLDSDHTVDVECKDPTSGFKVRRIGDDISEVVFCR